MKKKISKSLLMTALITGLCFGGVQGVFAAEDLNTFALDEYVVTATRTLKQLQEVPASVSIVTAKDIEERNVNSVQEALQNLPGVYMNPTAQSGIQMRGFGGTDILVLIDGQQMNTTYNGSTNLNSIPIESIERIEVLRGAASSIYGGHAVGGVINITTKEAKKVGTHGEAVISYGSNDTWKQSLQVQSKVNDKWSFGVGYEKRKSDGYEGYWVTKTKTTKTPKAEAVNMPDTLSDGKTYVVGTRGEKAWEHENINANIKYNFDENKSLKYIYNKIDTVHNYVNGTSFLKDANGNTIYTGIVQLPNGEKVSLSARNFYGSDNHLERDTHALIYNDIENKFTASFNYVDNKTDGFTSPTSRSDLDGSEAVKNMNWTGEGDYSSHPGKVYNFNIEKAWENIGGKHTIVIGADLKQEEMTQDRFTVSSWHNPDSKINHYAQDDGEVKNAALFIQDEYKITEPLTMYLGARLDYYKKGAGTFWSTEAGNEYSEVSDSETYTELSPKVSFDYKANDSTNYYVSYGHSFNPPEMYKIYRYSEFTSYWYIPNPDLDPETSDTFELGMKKRFSDNTNLGITFYHVDTDDKIAASGVLPGQSFKGKGVKQYDNFNKEERNGVEFELTHTFSDKFSGYLNYAWQQGKLEDTKGNESYNYDIPKHLLHAGIQYNHDKWNALLDCQYVSERQAPDDDASGYGAEEAYFLVNTAINYKLNENATLQFAINNLLDREFYASEATDGRTYYATLRYSF